MTAARRTLMLLVVLVAAALVTDPAKAAQGSAASWMGWPAVTAQGRELAAPSAPRWRTEAARSRTMLHRPAGSRGVPVPVPQTVTVSSSTHTVYATSDAGIVAVIDARRCNAHRSSGCGAPVATMSFGDATTGDVAVDQASGTGYVTNIEDGTVSVFDAAHCNARDTSGCAAAHAAIAIGGIPIGLAINTTTGTLYVGNIAGFVSAVEISACNRASTAGCADPPARATTNPGTAWPTVDEATDTVYAPENGPDDESQPRGATVAVIDGSTCNATTTSGCDQTPARVTVGNGPVVATVDPTTRTVYVENADDFTVSVVDGATCNAQDTSGCDQAPPTIRVGATPNSNLVVDPATRTLFVVNTQSDTISAVDIRHCRAGDTAGCSRRSRTIQTGNQPFWIELDQSTGTLYVPQHIDADVAAFDAATCNARRHSGCRREAPTIAIPDGVFSVAADPSTNTLYAGGGETGALSLVDTRRCRAGRLSGCGQTPFEAHLGSPLRDIVIDRATHTIYVIEISTDSLFVLDARTCNAGRHTDCAPRATLKSGPAPIALALNRSTHAVYTADIGGSVSVFDGAHCNAVDQSGCASAPETIPLEGTPLGVTVDPGTGTVYVSLIDASAVAVLHGSDLVATIPIDFAPVGLGVDAGTHTLYVANFAGTDAPGSVTVVDTRTCNGVEFGSCDQQWPTVPTGRAPWAIAIDPATHRVFTANNADATVSVIPGGACNATDHRRCDREPRRIAVGNIPLDLSLDRRHHTLYVANAPDRDVSVIDSRR
jgi:DNA-binding beta-propeller fold protein YncE